jgi:RNA polymerase sigma-70 factor (ECF subfamily)
MNSKARVSDAWNANRAYLTNLAFGILGDLGAAEDAVQEAFTRLVASDEGRVEDERGWLIVVTSRICFDKVRSAPHRLESTRDAPTLDILTRERVPSALGDDPLDRITLDDEVRLALLVVLQRLSPAERVVFVLHDIFRLPFEVIGKTVGRPVPSCRQLARRARMKLQHEETRSHLTIVNPEHQRITEGFIEACSTGDIARLVALLDPEVAGDVDLGPLDERTGSSQRGSDAVSSNFLRYFGKSTLVAIPGYGRPMILGFLSGRLRGVISLEIRGSRVGEIHVLADPVKMSVLESHLS